MHSSLALALGFLFAANTLAIPAPAQQPLPTSLLKRSGNSKRLVYDYAERRVVRNGAPKKNTLSTFCYVNTDTVNIYTSGESGKEIIDWGVLGGTMSTKCAGLSPVVTQFNFAYGTSTADTSIGGPGAALTLTFYTGWKGYGDDSGNCPAATFAFTGLPGYSGSSTGLGSVYRVSVDVSSGGEFCMPDGRFGYGYRGDGQTGPLLCLTGDGAGGPEPCTGNEPVFDVWVPDTKGFHAGTFFFSGASNILSWYGQIARADLSGTPASVVERNCPPNQPSSLLCTAPVLGDVLTATITSPPGYLSAFCFAFDSPAKLTLGGGQVLLCLDLGGMGELLSGAGLAATPAGTVGGSPQYTCDIPLPKNVDYCGFTFCMQALCAFGVTPFALTSACDLTIGG